MFKTLTRAFGKRSEPPVPPTKSPGRPDFDWHSGHPGRDIGDGPNAFEFQLVTDKDSCVAVIHPRLSLLFSARDLKTPVAQVPSEMILSYVKDKTGHDLFEYLRGGPDLR